MRTMFFNKAKLKSILSMVFIVAVCIGLMVFDSSEELASPAGMEADLLKYVVSSGEKKNSAVSLMFMVDENTDIGILSETIGILADNKIKATFFVTGKFAESQSDIMKQLTANGHEIGVSGYEAVSPANLDYSENLAALEKATTVIRNTTGNSVKLYSPPYGVLETDIYKAANEQELKYILASVDSMDWDDVSTEAIISTVLNQAEKGSFISFHPTQMTNLGMQTIINELKGLGLGFMTISENLS